MSNRSCSGATDGPGADATGGVRGQTARAGSDCWWEPTHRWWALSAAEVADWEYLEWLGDMVCGCSYAGRLTGWIPARWRVAGSPTRLGYADLIEGLARR